MAVHNVMISCSHEAVIESGYVEVAPRAPFVRGDVPDARVEEYQRAVPVGEATDHPRASPDLPIKHVHHVFMRILLRRSVGYSSRKMGSDLANALTKHLLQSRVSPISFHGYGLGQGRFLRFNGERPFRVVDAHPL